MITFYHKSNINKYIFKDIIIKFLVIVIIFKLNIKINLIL